MKTKELLDEIIDLPTSTRVRIAQEILESLNPTMDPEIEKAWIEEAARRDEAPLSEDIPREEVFRKAREIISD